jgi:hypothetical protein
MSPDSLFIINGHAMVVMNHIADDFLSNERLRMYFLYNNLKQPQFLALANFTSRHCCGAGPARSHIILVETEQQRDAVPALVPTLAPTAPNLMLNIGRLSKIAQTITIYYFSHFYSNFNQKEIRRKNCSNLN